MGNIVWLASYPKSGNTWMRILLANYLQNGDEPADINRLGSGPIASARQAFDERVAVEAADLTPDEVDRLRPAVYEQISNDAQGILFMKVHDAFTLNNAGQPLFPEAATQGVLYLVRNPLDVAVSFAHHNAQPVEKTVETMGAAESKYAHRPDRLPSQLRQQLLSWSQHVESWLNSGFNVNVVRYEDMKADTVRRFTDVVSYCELDTDPDRIAKAVQFSQFDSVRKQEQEKGFRERVRQSNSFFRKGAVGSWREELSPELIEKLISDHGPVMQRLGYLSDNEDPIFWPLSQSFRQLPTL